MQRRGIDKSSSSAEEGRRNPVQERARVEGTGDRTGRERAQHNDPPADHGEPQAQDPQGEVQKEPLKTTQVRGNIHQ